ncbi:MAG: hypothetical protein A2081_05505 [Elusimicrobia bacterium GWC2_61_19]|nr:MAG: hypothetical protein A2081_05505 [Elusimicrobia bacterium GWC2_61_19]
MERLSAALLGADARAVLRRLGGLGAMELIRAVEGPETAPRPPADNAAALASCRNMLSRAEELRRVLGPNSRRAASPTAMTFGEAAAVLSGLESEAKYLLERRRLTKEALAAAVEAREKIAPYAGLPLPSDRLSGFSFIRCFTGSLPRENFKALVTAGAEKGLIVPLGENGGRTVVLGLADRDRAAALAGELRAAGFRPEAPPVRPGLTLAEASVFFSSEESREGQALLAAEQALAELAGRFSGPLAAIEGAAQTEARLLEAESAMPRTGSAVLLSGWAPALETGALRREMRDASSGRCALEQGAEQDGAPVLLRPPAWLRPFTELVRAYGLPCYREVDPTAFAAIVYVLTFGAMFGDVGHGAVVCAGGLWLAVKGRAAARAAGRMAVYCGLSGMFFGLVYGSFFGLEFFKKYALWRDPLKGDPLVMVLAALAAGAAVISLGVVLNIVNRAGSGDRLGAALGRFGAAGLLFYWCAIFMLAGKVEPRFGLPVIGAALACWALKEPLAAFIKRRAGEKSDSGLEALAEGMVGAFEGVLLYLANTVSFARLAAYAMSHAALVASAYMLAAAADKAWGPGSLAGLAAIVAGNAAAILLEGTVAAVQALRLEYYEFFGKFFEGGGRPFRPFVLKQGA